MVGVKISIVFPYISQATKKDRKEIVDYIAQKLKTNYIEQLTPVYEVESAGQKKIVRF
ncbi:hypothetical protein KAW18_01460 [candidate division WOR-3 bacterium]|nr:hypothetical protein [candidate division WOR-3 bacterium]